MWEFAGLLWKLFATFFKIGLFGFGGGYGMISMIQFEVVSERGWMTASEFADILAISQMTPGPISINCATYVGYTSASRMAMERGLMDPVLAGVASSVFTSLALCLPTVILMVGVIMWLFRNKENRFVRGAMSGLKPAVVGLILSAAVLMMNGENFVGRESVVVCGVAFVCTYWLKLNPIFLIMVSGAFGYLYYIVYN